MIITHASAEHASALNLLDCHITEAELHTLISQERVLVAEEEGQICGWLRWNLFWDNTPFMNMLFVLEAHRGAGLGKAIVQHWEAEMKRLGHEVVMTSTASDEYAQHFYQKLGYKTIGGFTLFDEPYELMLAKKL